MSSQSSQVVESWIAGFCNLLGHEYFAEISEDFIEDDFNLTGLSSQVPLYKEALEMILDVEPEEEDEEEEEEEEEDDDEEGLDARLQYRRASDRSRGIHDVSMIESSAELLYGLIHQRYINSRPGMQQMHDKYHAGHFGRCPRVLCVGSKVLPVGISDTPGEETVKLFCPSCLDVYTPPNSRFQTVDGAFFGTTFGCLFLMTYPELPLNRRFPNAPADSTPMGTPPPGSTTITNQSFDINGVQSSSLGPSLGRNYIYEPRVFGFRVNERAKSGPRMQWLRMKPEDMHQLDEAKRFYSEDMDEDMDDDAASPDQTQAVDKRKKAPIRRRRRINSGTNADPENKDVNGTR